MQAWVKPGGEDAETEQKEDMSIIVSRTVAIKSREKTKIVDGRRKT